MRKTIHLVVGILLTITLNQNVLAAEKYNNDNALSDVNEPKVYFDVNVGEAKKLLLRLQLIATTYNQLVAANFSPRFVIGLRGKASNFFTKDSGYILDEDLDAKKSMMAAIERFKTLGIRIEQCKIAADLQEIEVADFLPQLDIVANGYVSMIGYQSKGYAFVPMD